MISKEEAFAAVKIDNVAELPHIVIAVSLNEENLEWAQEYCLSLASHSNEYIRGNAILGFGHLARRFGRLTAAAKPLIQAGLTDTSSFVRGQAVSAADDVGQFLGW